MWHQWILPFLIGLGIGSPIGWIMYSLARIRREQ